MDLFWNLLWIAITSFVVAAGTSYFLGRRRADRIRTIGRLQGRAEMLSSLVLALTEGRPLEEWVSVETDRHVATVMSLLSESEQVKLQVKLDAVRGAEMAQNDHP